MSQFDSTPATGLPSLLQQGLASAARAGFNALGGMLVTAGVLTGDQSTMFVTVGVACALWGGSWLWSQIKNRGAHQAVKVALATPAPGQVAASSRPSRIA